MIELNRVYCEDCRDTMKRMDDNSVDSIVTDPPYDLTTTKRWGKETKFAQNQSDVGKRFSKGFMGKEWDGTGIAFDPDLWKECLRVLKPGGYLLAFGGTRTQHRMVCAIEDAGFEIRDTILWIYGSGFPKSLDISKAIDKEAGNKRDLEQRMRVDGIKSTGTKMGSFKSGSVAEHLCYSKEGISDNAKQYEGWGTALKPACEPICMARKPLSESTVAKNVLKHGTGGINIDGCRIEGEPWTWGTQTDLKGGGFGTKRPSDGDVLAQNVHSNPQGRFPANVILDGSDEVLQGFPETSSGKMNSISKGSDSGIYGKFNGKHVTNEASEGSAARFFYIAKADQVERQDGCHEMQKKPSGMISNTSGQHITRRDGGAPAPAPKGNNHPTVKPIKLMQYLQRLITPKGGLTYDPFGGSGTSALSASNEGFKWILSEMIPEHCDIANKRIYNNNGLFQ